MGHYPKIDEVKDSLSGLTSEHGITANGADEAVKALEEFEKKAMYPYNIFFNDLSQGDDGEGVNLIKLNMFCENIPEKHHYNKIRNLILEKLEEGFSKIINEAMDNCLSEVSSVTGALAQIDKVYVDFVENRENYAELSTAPHFAALGASGYFVTEGEGGYGNGYWPGQAADPINNPTLAELCDSRLNYFLKYWGPNSNLPVYETNIDLEAYKQYMMSVHGTAEEYLASHPNNTIEDYNKLLEYSYSIDDYGVFCSNTGRDPYEGFTSWADVTPTIDFSSILTEAQKKIEQAGEYIKEWIALGQSSCLRVAFTQNIYQTEKIYLEQKDTTVYDKLLENKEVVNHYSEKITHSLDVVQKIHNSSSDTSNINMIKQIIDVVCMELNVKSQCDRIYENLLALYENQPEGEA